MEYKYKLDFKSAIESNEFLRCLWYRIRVNFGKLAWNLSPIKQADRNRIHFGLIDIGEVKEKGSPISVSCTYKKRGCLNTISFHGSEFTDVVYFETELNKSIEEAKDYTSYKRVVYLEHTLSEYISFAYSKTDSFSVDGNKLRFKIIGYDKEDWITFSQNVVSMLMAFLSFDTLRYISAFESRIETLRKENDRKFVLINTDDSEEYSEFNLNDKFNNLHVSDFILTKIEEYLSRPLDYEQEHTIFENSIKSFSQALLFEELSQSIMDINSIENQIISYMTSLEIITLNNIDKKKCKECGQNVYSISKRVISLVKNATDDNKYLSKVISNYYNTRSKYVHTGKLSSTYNYTGTSIPLLSSSNENGVINQTNSLDNIVKDLVKECILWSENNK